MEESVPEVPSRVLAVTAAASGSLVVGPRAARHQPREVPRGRQSGPPTLAASVSITALVSR